MFMKCLQKRIFKVCLIIDKFSILVKFTLHSPADSILYIFMVRNLNRLVDGQMVTASSNMHFISTTTVKYR